MENKSIKNDGDTKDLISDIKDLVSETRDIPEEEDVFLEIERFLELREDEVLKSEANLPFKEKKIVVSRII